MRLLKAGERRRTPWKNGGGETAEVAVHPPSAGLADFDWRVSMATVAADGPFSTFPGVDRTLAIVEGEGLDLVVEGYGAHRLTLASAPFAFPGDVPAAARLLAGPVTDLNIMTRRGAFRQRVQRLGSSGLPFEARARWTVLVALAPSTVTVEGRTAPMERFDALLLEGGPTVGACDEGGAADLLSVEIDAAP